MTPTSPQRLLAALVAGGVLALPACGLPSDGQAHVIETDDLPMPLATPPEVLGTSSPETPPAPRNHVSVPARVYFVRERHIEPVTTIVRTEAASSEVVAADLLTQLKLGPGIAPYERGLTSRLTGDRRVQLLYIIDAVAVVELGPPPDSAGETRDGLWTAQVVMTLASLDGITAVRFTGADAMDVKVVLPNGKLVGGDITPLMVSSAVEDSGPTPSRTGGVRGTAKAVLTGTATAGPRPAARTTSAR